MILTTSELEQREKSTLASYAVTNLDSQGREYPEYKDPYRLDFQRDRDRIIHAQAFRRLKEKTQVFVAHYGDHYRNRLTHSLEAAQLARDIARNLNVNEDLVESIALAHDLGHTPFGHAGETALDQIMHQFNLHFEHNEQSKRIVSVLEKKYPHLPGLNLTKEVLDGLSKHQTIYDQHGKEINGLSIEAQIVNISDEIAYQNHDIDDGIRAGILKFEELSQLEIFQKATAEIKHDLSESKYFRLGVSSLIKYMVNDLYRQTELNLKEQKIKILDDVYASKKTLVSFSADIKNQNNELRKFLYQKFYHHPKVQKQNERGQKIIEFLFDLYFKNPPVELKKKMAKRNDPLHIVIKDYIAGMTDAYAEKQFNAS